MTVFKRARRPDPLVPVTENTVDAAGNRRGHRSAVLERKGDDCSREVGILSIGSEDRTAQRNVTNRTRERRQPRQLALPDHSLAANRLRRTIDAYAKRNERCSVSFEIPAASRKLYRRAGVRMQHPGKMNRSIYRMDAGERQPVITRDLPWN